MPGKRVWRKLLKKLQRQRRRQKCAKERQEAEVKQSLEPAYQNWLQQQTELMESEELAAKRQHDEEEEAWLRREAVAQRQFQLDALKLKQQEAAAQRLRDQQAQELAEQELVQRKRHEERQRLAAQAAEEFESMIQAMQNYLDTTDDDGNTPPSYLKSIVETRPSERLCEFFTCTNSCRFGNGCAFNHKRPMLSKILLIRHFFNHPLLQVVNENRTRTDYAEDADSSLELTEQDLRADYDTFFADVLPELEKFGSIVNFRTLRNTLSYLRGHVFVEYKDERSALRAFVNLQGRYYASKPLSVEFSNLQSWHRAICGLSLMRKCPKGFSCGYLHLLRNPNNLYNVDLMPQSLRITEPLVQRTPGWNDTEKGSRNWRWSESPELELNSTPSVSVKNRRDGDTLRYEKSDCKPNSRKESHYTSKSDDRKRSRSRSKTRSHKKTTTSSGKHRNKSKSPRYEEETPHSRLKSHHRSSQKSKSHNDFDDGSKKSKKRKRSRSRSKSKKSSKSSKHKSRDKKS